MFVSNRIVFLEREFLKEGIDVTKIELEEVWQVEKLIQTSENTELDLMRSNPEPIIEASLRRSGKVLHQSDRYYGFLV